MHQPVSVQVTGGVAVLTIDHPPLNALEGEVRLLLSRALDVAQANDTVTAVLLGSKGRSFATGGNVDEKVADKKTPSLLDLCAKIERFPVPVFAALHGDVTGPGLELGLAAHFRIADRRARFGFPDVRDGMPPFAGGSQRLPRLIGVKPSLDLLLSGQMLDPKAALELGLVDAVAAGPLPKFALQWAKDGVDLNLEVRPVADRSQKLEPAKPLLKLIQGARDGLPPQALTVHRGILDCLEAALILPFEAAVSKEQAVFDDCLKSPESQALRHAGQAERRAAVAPVEAKTSAAKLNQIGIVGGGRIGRGVAASCLEAGYQVVLVEQDMDHLEEAVEGIIDVFDQDIARGRLDAEERDGFLGHLSGTIEVSALAGADLVLEATPEEPGSKRQVFSALDAVMKQGAVLATATSAIDIDGLAAGTGRSDAVVGLHFFPPSNRLRTVEVVIGVDTSDLALATAFSFVTRLDKIPVSSAVNDGYLAYRMFSALLDASLVLAAQGTPISEIDNAMETYGFPLGPFRLADALGVDVSERLQPAHSSELGLRIREILSRMVAGGRTGRKAGRGFYTYRPGGKPPVLDPELGALLTGLIGTSETVPANMIRRRCISALANQGMRLVEDQVAQRPSDLDVIMMQVFGYPRHRGGPMMAADLAGLARIKRDLDRFAAELPEIYTSAPKLRKLVKRGKTLASMNT